MNIDEVLSKLEKVRATNARQWMACCPAHPDKTPSLSISLGDDERILLHCHAGCAVEAVLNALQLEMKALFPTPFKAFKTSEDIHTKSPIEEEFLGTWEESVKNPHSDLSGLIDWHELFNNPPFIQEWLAYPIVPKSRLVSFFGPGKIGKSLFMLELAASVATGRDFLGHPTTKVRVLYVDRENDPRSEVRERLEKMGFIEEELKDNLLFLSYPTIGDLDTKSGAATLIDWVDKHNIDFVIVDTISRFIAGKENDNDTYFDLYKLTELELKKRGVTFLRIDHTGLETDGRARGASAKEQDVDITWSMVRTKNGSFKLRSKCHRMFIEVNELTLTKNLNPLRFDWSDTPEDKTEEARIEKMIKLLDTTTLPKTATVRKTQAFINDELKSSMGTDTITKLVRIRKSRSSSEPSWSDEEHLQPQHQLTEEDLLQSEHNAFHAKRRSAPKMERERFSSFHDDDGTTWNEPESDGYSNEW